MRFSPILVASTLVIAMTAVASAKPKGMGHGMGNGMGYMGYGMGRGMGDDRGRDFGSSAGSVRPWNNPSHPAYWAPGHVKKREGAKSARMYAPNRAQRETYPPPGERLR